MSRERVIVDFKTPEDAKKVEETVKTGYVETSIENILQWEAVEGDLAETYRKLAGSETDSARKSVYSQLQLQSRENLGELAGLRSTLERLDRTRVERIERLAGLLA